VTGSQDVEIFHEFQMSYDYYYISNILSKDMSIQVC
jgi:hypothetical protein